MLLCAVLHDQVDHLDEELSLQLHRRFRAIKLDVLVLGFYHRERPVLVDLVLVGRFMTVS